MWQGHSPSKEIRRGHWCTCSLSCGGSHNIGDGKTIRHLPRTVIGVEWNWPEPFRQTVCAVGEVELPQTLGAQKIMSESKMPNIELQDLI